MNGISEVNHPGARLGALLLAAAALLGAPLPAAATETPAQGITVQGHGVTRTVPDRARLSLAVDVVDRELASAQAQVNRVVRSYLDALKTLKIEDRDIATSAVSMQPEYNWDEARRQQTLVGYRARRDIEITVHRLEQLGAVIEQATRAGVNQVSPPRLESSRAAALEREALALAAQDAQARAQALASALGLRLGAAQRVTETGMSAPPVPYKAMAARAEAMDSGGADMALSTGEIRFDADVVVQFALIGP